ncbi:MAG: outer membrane protein assembly factor BamE [Nitrospiraceae bacterium]|nr:outer membrane protein assembly factor BamE [Nitrospiraceae bacterium]
MKKINLVFCVSLLVFSLGCIEAIRYSPDEIKTFPPDIQESIKHGVIKPGMTIQQVRYAWGAPTMINILKPADDGKSREEWTYRRGLLGKTRLLFIDNKLTHIISDEAGVSTN